MAEAVEFLKIRCYVLHRSLCFQTKGGAEKMSTRRKFITAASIALLAVVAIHAFLPALDVNVIFDRPLNSDEVATVFQDTSIRTIQHISVVDWGRGGGGGAFTNNSIFGTPLYGEALEEALASESRGTGFAILAGQVSFIDMVRIARSPFVYDVAIYSPYFRLSHIGQRRVLGNSQRRFYENIANRRPIYEGGSYE